MIGPPETYLGIDLGTSGLKLTMVGSDGSIVAESEAAYDVHAPRPGFAETDPADWSAALVSAEEELAATVTGSDVEVSVAGVGVTGQMHGVVLVDAEGSPVRPAVLWPDQRAASALDGWTEMEVAARAALGNPLVAGMAGPILSWLREHEPQSLATAALVRSPKDWLRGLLTGDRVTERTDASATLLWDVVTDDWSPAAIKQAGIVPAQLPAVVKSDEVVGTTGGVAGLWRTGTAGSDGVPVVAGGADIACALTALQATNPRGDWADTLIVNLGTGIQILRPGAEASPRPEPKTHLYADADGGWYEMLAIQNGGLALGWVQGVLGLGWDVLVDAARSAPAGSAGATFVPFLTGERGLVAPAGPTAGWSGLTPSVGRRELARSAFEAVAFTIRRGVEGIGGHDGSVVLSGGGAREPWVRQLVADVLERPLNFVQLRSASAVGAAVLAARGVGDSMPVTAPVSTVEPSPDPVLADAYRRWSAAVA